MNSLKWKHFHNSLKMKTQMKKGKTQGGGDIKNRMKIQMKTSNSETILKTIRGLLRRRSPTQ